MPPEQIVDIGRAVMKEVLLVASPILAIAILVSLIVNIFQVLTSLQEITISSVPRLLAVGAGLFFLMPWMWRQLFQFTLQFLGNFQPYVR